MSCKTDSWSLFTNFIVATNQPVVCFVRLLLLLLYKTARHWIGRKRRGGGRRKRSRMGSKVWVVPWDSTFDWSDTWNTGYLHHSMHVFSRGQFFCCWFDALFLFLFFFIFFSCDFNCSHGSKLSQNIINCCLPTGFLHIRRQQMYGLAPPAMLSDRGPL